MHARAQRLEKANEVPARLKGRVKFERIATTVPLEHREIIRRNYREAALRGNRLMPDPQRLVNCQNFADVCRLFMGDAMGLSADTYSWLAIWDGGDPEQAEQRAREIITDKRIPYSPGLREMVTNLAWLLRSQARHVEAINVLNQDYGEDHL